MPAESLQVGSLAPDFTLSDVRGGDLKLSEDLGKWGVLVFYRGGWCPLCNRQLGELSSAYARFSAAGAEIYAISNEAVKKGARQLQRMGPPYRLLADPESQVIRAYDLLVSRRDPLGTVLMKQNYAHPAVFVVDKDRVVRWRYVGRTYRDRPSAETLLEAIAGLNP